MKLQRYQCPIIFIYGRHADKSRNLHQVNKQLCGVNRQECEWIHHPKGEIAHAIANILNT